MAACEHLSSNFSPFDGRTRAAPTGLGSGGDGRRTEGADVDLLVVLLIVDADVLVPAGDAILVVVRCHIQQLLLFGAGVTVRGCAGESIHAEAMQRGDLAVAVARRRAATERRVKAVHARCIPTGVHLQLLVSHLLVH